MDLLAYSKEIVAVLAPVLQWGVGRALQPKARLAWSMTHSFAFLIQEPLIDEGKQIAPTKNISTGSILIQNLGQVTLEGVEVVFNWQPLLNIWPIRHYEERVEADGRYVMIFENLSVGEFVQIELLERTGLRELPVLLTVRSKQCVAENIPLVPQQVAAAWKVNAVKLLAAMGIGASVYLIIIGFQFLVLGTPKVLGG